MSTNQPQTPQQYPLLHQRTHRPITTTRLTLTTLLLLPTACTHHARVELSAATALDHLAAEVETALDEYHSELSNADRDRRSAVIDAFVTRIRTDHANQQQSAAHVQQFNDALDRILADTDVERQRLSATRDNITTIRTIAAELRQFAIQSTTLNDDLQRYIGDLLQPTNGSPIPTGGPRLQTWGTDSNPGGPRLQTWGTDSNPGGPRLQTWGTDSSGWPTSLDVGNRFQEQHQRQRANKCPHHSHPTPSSQPSSPPSSPSTWPS